MHRERAHLKVPGFSIVLNVLLTRKLPTFLSRLNEISGDCENVAPVSGSFCSILKLLRMMAFYWVIVRVKCEGEWSCHFFSFCDVCSADSRSVC